MKNRIIGISGMDLLARLTAIAALCIALPARAGLPYPSASTVSQLIADINYANSVGGTFTINLQTNTTFDLLTYDNSNGGPGLNGLPVIGGTKTVNLTIMGNGDTLQRDASAGYQFRLFEVAKGSSLTLTQMTLQGGYSYADNGGAIYNQGMLTISGCTLTNNTAWYSGYISTLLGGDGGAIYNGSGTVVINNSTLNGNTATGSRQGIGGAIYNESGTLTISNTTLHGNAAGGFAGDDTFFAEAGAIYNGSGRVTISHVTVSGNAAAGPGSGIFSAGGTTTVQNSSRITGNGGEDMHNSGVLYLDDTSTIGLLGGNLAIIVWVSEPSLRISLTSSNSIVVSWPYPSTGWSLHQNSDLTTANWVTPTNTVANDGTKNFMIATPSLERVFFRLKH